MAIKSVLPEKTLCILPSWTLMSVVEYALRQNFILYLERVSGDFYKKSDIFTPSMSKL